MLTSKEFIATKRSYLHWDSPDQESNTYPTELAWHVLVRGL